MNIADCEVGKSYACYFQVVTYLDADGAPMLVEPPSDGRPGLYKGFGVIVMRDTEKRLVRIRDTQLEDQEFTVSWDDCWDVDTVEWTES